MGLNSRRYLCHPNILLIVMSDPWGWGRLVCESVLGLLRIEFVCRPVAEFTVLFHVTVVGISSGFHWDIRGEGVGGFVETVVADTVVLLGFVVG